MSSRKNKEPQKPGASDAKKILVEKIDDFLSPHVKVWFWVSFSLLALLCLFFFDPKVSIGGDDSEYINRGYDLISKGKFPGFQGPLYPIMLGIVMSFSGINLRISSWSFTTERRSKRAAHPKGRSTTTSPEERTSWHTRTAVRKRRSWPPRP